jgi:hypothetical protein
MLCLRLLCFVPTEPNRNFCSKCVSLGPEPLTAHNNCASSRAALTHRSLSYPSCASCSKSTRARSRPPPRRCGEHGQSSSSMSLAVLTLPLQLLSHLHASLGDELTDASCISKLPDAAQVGACCNGLVHWGRRVASAFSFCHRQFGF